MNTANEPENSYKLPWSKQQTTLRQVNLRAYGTGPKTRFSKDTWNGDGRRVLAILRANSIGLTKDREQAEESK